MNKPIIIDGVDVSKCHHFDKDNHQRKVYDCYEIEGFPNFCKGDNCYYKQLQRLKNTLKHVEKGRKIKAEKLKKIEEIIIHCIQGGFTDDFIQQIFDLCRENEDI